MATQTETITDNVTVEYYFLEYDVKFKVDKEVTTSKELHGEVTGEERYLPETIEILELKMLENGRVYLPSLASKEMLKGITVLVEKHIEEMNSD